MSYPKHDDARVPSEHCQSDARVVTGDASLRRRTVSGRRMRNFLIVINIAAWISIVLVLRAIFF